MENKKAFNASFHERRARKMAPIVWLSMFAALVLPPLFMAFYYHEKGEYTGTLIWTIPLLLALTLRRSRERSLRIAKGLRQKSGEEVVANSLNRNSAFILYLREFDLERKNLDDFADLGLIGTARHPSDVEAQIVEMFDCNIPVVGLTDPENPTPLPGIHRLSEVPESWEPIVNELIKSAYLIIVSLDKISEGVSYELDQINTYGRDEHTIIIAGKRNVARRIKRTRSKERLVLGKSIWIKQGLKKCIKSTGRDVGFTNKNGFLHKLCRIYGWPMTFTGGILIITLAEGNVGMQEFIYLFFGAFFGFIFVRWFLRVLVKVARSGWRTGVGWGDRMVSGKKGSQSEMRQYAAETPKLDALMELLRANNR